MNALRQKDKYAIMNNWIDTPCLNGFKECPKEIVGLTVELDFGETYFITDTPENWIWFRSGNKANSDIIRYRVIGLEV